MDLTNFTATFNYASNKASRNIGSANKMNTIKGRLKRSIEPFYDDPIGGSMVQMIRDSVGIKNQESPIHIPSYKESIGRVEHRLNKRSVKPALKDRLSRSISDLEVFTNENTPNYKDARKKVTDFVRKNREEYPKQAKALHEILSRPDEAYDVGKAKIKPNIDIPSQYTYSSSRMNAIDKIITESNGTSKAAKSAAKAAVGEGAAEAAKTAGKEAAEKVAKKSAENLWDLAKKNKVPQIALGVAATAWLVNKLSDSRGQQSNAQLYGQQGY